MTAASFALTQESRATIRRLQQLGRKAVVALEEGMTKVGAWMLRSSLRAFDNHRQEGGLRWAANKSPKYIWFKRVIRGQNPPRQGELTGALRRSISLNVHTGKILKAVVGSPKDYAKRFVEGSHRARKFVIQGIEFKIQAQPPRPIFPAERPAERYARGLFNNVVADFARRHG